MDGRDWTSRHHHGSIENGLTNGIATGGPPRRAPTHIRFSRNLPQFYPTIDMDVFKPNDWKSFYGNVVESIPSNEPESRGKDVDLRLYVDSDHAGEKRTRRLRTGFFVFMNTALVQWFSETTDHDRNLSFRS